METIELSLSPKYVCNWGLAEAVREILQNAIDCSADGEHVAVSYQGRTLAIATNGGTLDKSTLLLGESGKDDARYIGKYGEGYKLALLVLTREGHDVCIYTGDETWTPVLRKSETFGMDTLQIDIEVGGKFENSVVFEINGISESDMRDLLQLFPFMSRELGEDIGDTCETEYGTVLMDDNFAGKFFVNGLFVQDDTEFTYGYDFRSEYVSLDRDRKSINYYQLRELTAKALTSCGQTSVILGGLREGIADLSDDDTVLDTLSDEQSKEFKDYYFRKYDLPSDAFVGTAGMLPFVNGRKMYQDNEIIARIIAKADDAEDEFEELKDKVNDRENVDTAIERFDSSDYKKLLVWMKRQKRLSKTSQMEFMRILGESKSLYFSGLRLIADRIETIVDNELANEKED